MVAVFIGVGSNIDPEENVVRALRSLTAHVRALSSSTFYRTRALGGPPQPDYANGVVKARTSLSPLELKELLRRIETENGRVRSSDRYAPRTIDFDLLLYGDRIVSEPGLTIPSPDILERPFVMIPLLELEPTLMIPGSGRPIAQLAAEGRQELEPWTSLTIQIQSILEGQET
ncbi:MAG TPA: 2-amino-4-hydroxy-6-hydroxymethyldihydropteridine diphosphokinase [Spirochaetia bacterium]|nr:2-amino-4-hydroxy-6-hydroxymethyldihydropteridine diphosphokinase [Spirochaetia bacterium]